MRSALSCVSLLFFCTSIFGHAEQNPSWTTPIAPFQVADNLYYVGSQDLAGYLVVTSQGNILINANLATSPPQIRASVEKLGFHWKDTRALLNSQAHFDHMAGAAEVVHETHAKNMVMDADVSVAETGGRTDFLSPSPNIPTYPPVHVDRVLHDGDTVEFGGVTLTAHKTAGHTRGCTTWIMRSHVPGEPAGTTRNIVIVGGTGFWSEYHFVATPWKGRELPGNCSGIRAYIHRLARFALRCVFRSSRWILRYAHQAEALPAGWSPCLYRPCRLPGLRR